MLRISKILVLMTSLLMAAQVVAAGITESDVKKLISKVDTAVNDLNAQAIADVMSDDVEIIMNMNIQGYRQVMKPSKAEYLQILKQGWAVAEQYQYSRSNLKIEIQGDKALVSATVNESMTVQGQTISGTSKEDMVIESKQGAPLLTKIVAHVSL